MKLNKDFPKKLFLDKRVLVNGKKKIPAYINYENHLELVEWIQNRIDDKDLIIPCCNESYILKEEFLSLINHDAEINYNPIFKTVLSDYGINTKTIPPIYDFQSGVLNINVTGSSDGYQYGGIITRDKSYIISENYSILEFKNFSIGKSSDNVILFARDDINISLGYMNNESHSQSKFPFIGDYSLFIELELIKPDFITIYDFELDIKISQIVNGIKTSSLSSNKIKLYTNYDFELVIDKNIAKLFINNELSTTLNVNPILLNLPMSIYVMNISGNSIYDIFLDGLYYNK